MNIRYKMNKKFIGSIFTVLSIVMTFCLCGCQNEAVASVGAVSVSGGTAVLTLNIDNEAGRSAMPVIPTSELTKIELFAADADVSGDGRKIGEWESVEELNAAKISIYTGTWTFTLRCETSTLKFSDRQTVTVTAGTNVLTFRPMSSYDKYDTSGVGNLSVTISYPSEGVEAVTCGLYSLGGISAGAIYPDEDLTIDITANGSNSVYTLTDVSCDRYFAVFKFYGDADKTLLRGTYCEYCWIINGMTSTSNCTVEEIAGLFNIEYVLNGGSFAGGSAVYRSYTRYSDTVTLPEAAKANCIFGGWYDNEEFTGNPVRTITEGSTGNRTYYAKWIEDVTVTFDKNNENAAITTATQTMPVVQANLPLASALGLTHNAGNKFIGWAATADGEVQYTDGETVTFTEDTTLYAKWSVTDIYPADEGDTTDTDGDGLTDWYELNVSHTDPNNNDTDGDGWTDKEEVDMYDSGNNVFNPLIADAPAVEVILTEKPTIKYHWRWYDAINCVWKDEYEPVDNTGSIGSSLSPEPSLLSRKEIHTWSANYGMTANWGSAGSGYEISQPDGSESIANGDIYIYSSESSSQWAASWINGVEQSKNQLNNSDEFIETQLTVKYKIKNSGSVACDLNEINAAIMNIPVGTSESSVIASLGEINVGVLQPQGESAVYEKSVTIDAMTTEKLMKWSAGMTVEIADYTISVTSASGSRDYNGTSVESNTAKLFIDYGNGSTATYNVAAKNRFNIDAVSADNLYFPNDLEYVFNTLLDMSGDYELSGEGYIRSINGIANAADIKDGAWYIGHKYTEGDKRMLKTYSPYTAGDDKTHRTLSDIKICAGDEISLIYAKDADNDGVPLNEEILYGTDDTESDTDGDGLTDYEEIYGWWNTELDAKYSESNKVLTNPKTNDTDGDGLYDCSADIDGRDRDPLVHTGLTDTGIYCEYWEGYWGDRREQAIFDSEGRCNIGNCGSSVEMWVCPLNWKKGAVAQYRLGTDGDFADFDQGRYHTFVLTEGENTIYIKCTAADKTTVKIYEITVNSRFKSMAGFNATSPQYGETGGCVNLNWAAYADENVTAASDGGYVLYARKTSNNEDILTIPRDKANSAGAVVDNTADMSEFCIRLTPETLANGAYTVSGLAKNTYYCFYLFAYTGADSDETYQSASLGSKRVRTGSSRYAELNIYGHYVIETESHDGGLIPNYYWIFNNTVTDVLGIKPYFDNHTFAERQIFFDWSSSVPITAKIKTNAPVVYFYELLDNINKAINYKTGEKNSFVGTKYNGSEKFSQKVTKKISNVYDRTKNYSFTQTWEAWDLDFVSSDDYLGKVTANFTYNSATDTWTCSWSSTCGASGSSTITAGQRTGVDGGSKDDGLRWELHNTDEGEIEFHWDWGWDED